MVSTAQPPMTRSSYAPAPESRSIVDIKSSYGLFIDGEFVDGPRQGRSRRSARPPRRCSPRSPRPARPTSTRPSRRRAAPTTGSGRRCPAPSAASTSSGSPGSSRSGPRARRARVARQRQADQGVARRRHPAGRGALLLLRRLGRQARVRRLRARPAAARRRRPGDPVELPAADAGLEDRPRAGLRQHRRAQAGRDDAADRAAVRRDLPAGRPAAGRGQHRHRRRRRPAARWSSTPTSTRSRSPARPRSAGRSPSPSPAPARRSRSSSAARPPTSSSTTRRSTRPSRASSTASSSTRATSAAPARGCWCRSRWPTRCSTRLQAPDGHAARRRPAGQEHRHRRDQLRRAAGPRSASCPRSARPRAPSAGRRRASCPTRASGSRRRSSPASRQAHRIAREEIFGPVLSVLTFRTPERGGREGQQHAVRAVRRHLDRQGLADPVDGRPAARRRGLGQHVQPVRPDRRRSAATRSRATAARAAATVWRPTLHV